MFCFLNGDEEFKVSRCLSSSLHQVEVSCLVTFAVLGEKSLILVALSNKLTGVFSGE